MSQRSRRPIVRAFRLRIGPHRHMSRRLTCHGFHRPEPGAITVFVPRMPELALNRELIDNAWAPVDGLERVWHQTPQEALAAAVRASYGPAFADALVTVQFTDPLRPMQPYEPTGFPVGRPRSLPREE